MSKKLYSIKKLYISIIAAAALMCTWLTVPSEATVDLNGFTINGSQQQSGTSASVTQGSSGSGAFFSSGNLFGDEGTQATSSPVAEPQTGTVLPTPSVPLTGLTTQGLNNSQSLFGIEAGEYHIRWPQDKDEHITVLVNGTPAENGDAVTYTGNGRTVVISVVSNPDAGQTLAKCTVSFTVSRYDAATGQFALRSCYETMPGTQQGGFSYTIHEMLQSDITLEIQTSAIYPIYVCGVPVTDKNLNCILGEGNTTVTYNPGDRILSLSDAVIRGAVDIQTDYPVTIQLTGENRITGSPKGYGIHSQSALTIVPSGLSGVLTVYSESSESSDAILNDSGGVVIGSGAAVTAISSGGKASSSGINAPSVEVTGILSATAGPAAESAGIRCGSLSIRDGDVPGGSRITARGGTASAGVSAGIYAGSIRASGGSINAEAGSSAGEAYGICSADIVISGGTVTAKGATRALSSMPAYYGFSPQVRVSGLTGELREADSADASSYSSTCVMISSSILTVTPAELSLKKGESSVLHADVPSGYSVQWHSSSGCASVDPGSGRVTAVAAGSASITASAFSPSGTQAGSASCTVTVTAGEPVKVSGIRFDQEVVTLNAKDEVRTVRYWFTPLQAAETPLTWTCTDTGNRIIKIEISQNDHEFRITAVGNGTAVISASAEGGIKEYCRVTVNGISDEGSCFIDYMDNSGVWYYDRPEGFTLRCTGKESGLLGVYMDGVHVPASANGKTSWVSSPAAEGETILSFTKDYMSGLSRGKHTLSLSYSGVGSVWETIYIQAADDAPRTGDRDLLPFAVLLLLSGAGACISYRYRKRKEPSDGI